MPTMHILLLQINMLYEEKHIPMIAWCPAGIQ